MTTRIPVLYKQRLIAQLNMKQLTKNQKTLKALSPSSSI